MKPSPQTRLMQDRSGDLNLRHSCQQELLNLDHD